MTSCAADGEMIRPGKGAVIRRRAGTTVALMAVLGCSDGPTEPSGIGDFVWSTPEAVPEFRAEAEAKEAGYRWGMSGVTVDGGGAIHVTSDIRPPEPEWMEMRHVLYVRRNPDGMWARPEWLAEADSYSYGSLPLVDEGGTTHVVWYDRPRGSGQVTRLLHRRFQPDGTWTEPQALSATAPGARPSPRLTGALDGAGRLHVIHNAQGAFAFLEHLRLDPVSGAWVNQTMTAHHGSYTTLARAPDGSLWLSYVAASATQPGTSSRQDVWVSRYDGSAWSEPERVRRDDRRYSYSPVLMWDAGGRLHAVWGESDPDAAVPRSLLHAIRDPLTGRWGAARDVTPQTLARRQHWNLFGFTDLRGRPNILLESTDPGGLANPRISQMRLEGDRWTLPYFPVGQEDAAGLKGVLGRDGRVHIVWVGADKVLRYAVGELR